MFDAFVIRGSVLVVVAIFEVTQPTTSGTNKSLWHLHALPLEQVLHCASNFTQLMHFVGLQVDDGDDSLVSVEVRQLLATERHPALSDNQKKDVEASQSDAPCEGTRCPSQTRTHREGAASRV